MSNETTGAAKRPFSVRDLVLIALFAALMAICSWISIPTTVPFTLQTFAVFVAAGLRGGKRGTIAVLVYILLGAVGLPVFAGFSGGIGALLGSTGGYIIGFLGSALVMWGMEKLWGSKAWVQISSMVLGLLVCYAIGTAWFMAVYTNANGAVELATVLGWCVIPFIPGNFIKMAAVIIVALPVETAIRKTMYASNPAI